MLYGLCNGDITKFEQVTKQNFIFCLNWLSYQKMKAEADAKQMKKQIEKQKQKSR